MYALNLGEDNRILSATEDRFGSPNQPRVETLPKGNLPDYLYVDGEYIYNPVPQPTIDPQPSQLDMVEAQALYTAMMTDTLLGV